MDRPYRSWWYPWTPVVFSVLGYLIVNSVVTLPVYRYRAGCSPRDCVLLVFKEARGEEAKS